MSWRDNKYMPTCWFFIPRKKRVDRNGNLRIVEKDGNIFIMFVRDSFFIILSRVPNPQGTDRYSRWWPVRNQAAQQGSRSWDNFRSHQKLSFMKPVPGAIKVGGAAADLHAPWPEACQRYYLEDSEVVDTFFFPQGGAWWALLLSSVAITLPFRPDFICQRTMTTRPRLVLKLVTGNSYHNMVISILV